MAISNDVQRFNTVFKRANDGYNTVTEPGRIDAKERGTLKNILKDMTTADRAESLKTLQGSKELEQALALPTLDGFEKTLKSMTQGTPVQASSFSTAELQTLKSMYDQLPTDQREAARALCGGPFFSNGIKQQISGY